MLSFLSSRPQQQKELNSLFLEYITSVGNDFGSIEDRAMEFACSIARGFCLWCGGSNGVTAIFSLVVGLRLEGILVIIVVFIIIMTVVIMMMMMMMMWSGDEEARSASV